MARGLLSADRDQSWIHLRNVKTGVFLDVDVEPQRGTERTYVVDERIL